jgi:hypothetical protein
MLTLFGTVPGPFGDDRLIVKLAALPKPRTVGISGGDQVSVVVLFLLLGGWAIGWTRTLHAKSETLSGGAILAVFLGAFALWTLLREVLREIRNRSLLMNGEVSLGQISSQQTTGPRSKRSEITYEFIDASGRKAHGKGFDLTKEYAVNMPVIIFYEADDPSQNVAICATIWKLPTSGGGLVGD